MGNTQSTAPRTPPRGPQGRRRDIVLPHEQPPFDPLVALIHWIKERIPEPTPSILRKSPVELASDYAQAKSSLSHHMRSKFGEADLPEGHIRIHFHLSIGSLMRHDQSPHMTAVVPLEPSGELDLKKVRKVWNLETCTPVDPMRWKVFVPGQGERLSPLAVHILSQYYGAIKFIEPSVSPATAAKRSIRTGIIIMTSSSYHSLFLKPLRFLRFRTRLGRWIDTSISTSVTLRWQLDRWADDHQEMVTFFKALLIFASILYCLSLLSGFIERGSDKVLFEMIWRLLTE